ncbi:MAG: riboflavin synthase [bacterium]
MFTGLIQELGKVFLISNNKITISTILGIKSIGESVSVNGVCLTVSSLKGSEFTADISQETFRASNLKLLKPGSIVNLERALAADSLLGGHIVQGHVDTTVKILNITKSSDFYEFSFKLDKDTALNVVDKCSVALDGISLTVSVIKKDQFSVWIIPETFNKTNLKLRRKGDIVNLEVDIIAKYVQKQILSYKYSSKINMNLLKKEGYL